MSLRRMYEQIIPSNNYCNERRVYFSFKLLAFHIEKNHVLSVLYSQPWPLTPIRSNTSKIWRFLLHCWMMYFLRTKQGSFFQKIYILTHVSIPKKNHLITRILFTYRCRWNHSHLLSYSSEWSNIFHYYFTFFRCFLHQRVWPTNRHRLWAFWCYFLCVQKNQWNLTLKRWLYATQKFNLKISGKAAWMFVLMMFVEVPLEMVYFFNKCLLNLA